MSRPRPTSNNPQRDGVIGAAIRARKIPADAEELYRRLWAADAPGTQRLLTAAVSDGGLLPGQVPLRADQAPSAYPAEWFPETQSGQSAAPPSPSPAPAPVAPSAPVSARSAPAGGSASAYPPGWLPETQKPRAPAGPVSGDGQGGSIGLSG